MDLTPKHPRLGYAQARDVLRDIVDDSRFAIAFVKANGPRGWLLQPATVRGRLQALGTAPLDIVGRGRDRAVRIGRLPTGKIPIRFDTRLLTNVDALRQVARHEMAELNYILEFENQPYDMETLKRLLEKADSLGYEAEK